jgi:hypothetical protein
MLSWGDVEGQTAVTISCDRSVNSHEPEQEDAAPIRPSAIASDRRRGDVPTDVQSTQARQSSIGG